MKRKKRDYQICSFRETILKAHTLFWSFLLLVVCLLLSAIGVSIFLSQPLDEKGHKAAEEAGNVVKNKQERLKNSPRNRQSFAFIGKTARDDFRYKNKTSAIKNSPSKKGLVNDYGKTTTPSRTNVKLGGNNHKIEGLIPEMSIDLNGWPIETVAEHYGFLLVAVAADSILGKIIDGRFAGLSEAELKLYSKRGRSADTIENQWLIKRALSPQLDINPIDIEFIFLVPLWAERKFVDAELAAIEKAGLRRENVAFVQAFYDHNLNVQVREIFTKGNQRIEIE